MRKKQASWYEYGFIPVDPLRSENGAGPDERADIHTNAIACKKHRKKGRTKLERNSKVRERTHTN